eukprot:PhF_6_TR23820/c2_g1_i1/m.33373
MQLSQNAVIFHPKQYSKAVTVIIDEASGIPDCVRGLCAAQSSLRHRLRSLFASENLKIFLIVVGTGADGFNYTPGSLPNSYRIIRLKEYDVIGPYMELFGFPDHWIKFIVNGEGTVATMTREAVKNPRVMAAFVDRLIDFRQALHSSTGTPELEFVVGHALVSAILTYKRTNSLKDLTPEQSVGLAMRALQIFIQSKTNTKHISPEDFGLVAKYGVLTDAAEVRGTFEVPPEGYVLISENGNEKMYLKEGGHRYEMSQAQITMLRLGYGHFAHKLGWEGFDSSMEDYIKFGLLLDFRGKNEIIDVCYPVNDLTNKITVHWMSAPAQLNESDENSDILPLDEMFAQRTTDLVKNGSTIIIHNADKASYADTIILSKGKVVVLQYKFCTRTVLSSSQLEKEMHNMAPERPLSKSFRSLVGDQEEQEEFHRVCVVYGRHPTAQPPPHLMRSQHCHYFYVGKEQQQRDTVWVKIPEECFFPVMIPHCTDTNFWRMYSCTMNEKEKTVYQACSGFEIDRTH